MTSRDSHAHVMYKKTAKQIATKFSCHPFSNLLLCAITYLHMIIANLASFLKKYQNQKIHE